MDYTYLSILLVIIGLLVGIGLTFIINHFRVNNAESKIKVYLDKVLVRESAWYCSNLP